MNTIANTVASKLFVAFVAAAMLFTLAAPAQAQSVEQLQAQIAALMAQISGLSGSTTGTAACTFTRALTIGSEGADVKCLQDALTPMYFQNAGGSTGYFGPVTASAVASWQAANGVSPAVGYFGPVSQAKFAAVMTTPTTPTTPGTSSPSLSGEAALDDLTIEDASDNEIEEGAEEAELAVLTFEFADGDAEISRIDVELVAASGTEEVRPWKVFEEVFLFVNGKEVASTDADSKSDYSDSEDNDDSVLRFSGLKIVAEEDEELEVVVMANIQNSIDGAGSDADWTLGVVSVRYFDADGVATTDNNPTSDLADFSIEEEGQNDDAEIKKNSDTPKATTLKVEEDGEKSDEFEVFIFNIDVDEDSSELVLGEAYLTVETDEDNVANVVDGIWLDIDGKKVKGKVDSGSGTSVVYAFDFKEYELDGDEVYEAVVSIVFKGQDEGDNYSNGEIVVVSVDGEDWELESVSSGDYVLSGTRSSEDMTLSTQSATFSNMKWQLGATTIDFVFTVEAEDEDFDVLTADIMGTATGTATTSSGVLTRISGDSVDSIMGGFEVAEGDRTTFRVRYTVTGANGTYSEVTMTSVAGEEVDEDIQVSPTLTLNINS